MPSLRLTIWRNIIAASRHKSKKTAMARAVGQQKRVWYHDPSTERVARHIGPPNIEGQHLSWRFNTADLDGPYHCNLDCKEFKELWDRVRSFEKMNYDDLQKDGSCHSVEVSVISDDAKRRIQKLELDDILHLFGTNRCKMSAVVHEI